MNTANTGPNARPAYTAVFAVAQFRRYFISAVAAMNATWIFRVLLAWSAWDLTRSASFVGLVAAASLLPIALVGPLFGAMTDRSNIVRAYQRTTAALLACPVMLLGLLVLGLLTPAALLILSALYGVVLSAHHPVRQSLAPRLVDAPHISAVVALSALNFNVGRLLSPALGGALIGWAGLGITAFLSALLFVPGIIVARGLSPRQPKPKTTPTSLLADLAAGLRVAWERWPVRRSLLLSIVALGPMRAMVELLAVVADGTFARGAEGLGLLSSAVGFGALIAAVFQVVAGPRLLRHIAVRYSFVIIGFVTATLLVSTSRFDLAMLAAAVTGFSGTYVGVSLQIGLQARLEDDLRGRVMSLWMLAATLSTSLLAILISSVSEVLGLGLAATWTFSICALAVLLIALWRRDE